MRNSMDDPIWQTLREKVALQNENAELKQLLRLAIHSMAYVGSCSNCAYEELDICKKCEWKWRYAAEAERLLGGGDSNA